MCVLTTREILGYNIRVPLKQALSLVYCIYPDMTRPAETKTPRFYYGPAAVNIQGKCRNIKDTFSCTTDVLIKIFLKMPVMHDKLCL